MNCLAIYKAAKTNRPRPNNGWPANAISIDNMFNNITGTINNIVYPFC
jgi:hypothetical protein